MLEISSLSLISKVQSGDEHDGIGKQVHLLTIAETFDSSGQNFADPLISSTA